MYRIGAEPGRGTRADRWVARLSAAITPIAAVAWLLLLFLTGCSTATEFAPPPAETRARLGTVAIAAEPFEGVIVLALAPRGRSGDAAVGAGEGALMGLYAGVEFGRLFAQACAGVGGEAALMCLAIVAATFPVAVVIGAAVGAVEGYGPEEAAEEPGYDPAAMPQFRPEVELRRRFLRLGAAKADVLLVDADAAAGTEGAHDGAGPVPHDSRIEIEVTRFVVERQNRSVSGWSIELGARARIVLPGEAAEPYLRNWRYSGPRRSYFDVAEDDPVLRADLDTAFEVLADKMVFDLLLATEPEIRRGEPKPGTAWSVKQPNL